MRSFIILLSICIFMSFLISGCGKTYKGYDEIIYKARDEISVSNNDSIDLIIAGSSQKENNHLFWFISGNENQTHTYTPIEFLSQKTNEYKFVKTYKPNERISDIALLMWKDGYSFVINNTSCRYIRIKRSNGDILDISVDNIPFVYYIDEIPFEYSFLDNNKNVLK